MSIKSSAFGRLTLTGKDAKKFRDQVSYGRPKAAAVESVRSGIKLFRDVEKTGSLSVRIQLRKS